MLGLPMSELGRLVLPLINSKDSANMKNKNLNFSPKKLQTSPGSPQIMTKTTMK